MKDLNQIMKKPVSKETAKMVLANQEERDDFLIYYNFFEKDGNKDIYVNWINENLNSGSNVVVEHIFELSNYNTFICCLFKDIFLELKGAMNFHSPLS